MKIFNFCKPDDAMNESKKYLIAKGSFLFEKLKPFIPKNCEKLFEQILLAKNKVFFDHPRSWHFIYTTQKLISDLLNDNDPSPESISHLFVDSIKKDRVLELHLFNAIEQALLYSHLNNCKTRFTLNFQMPTQTYLPGIGNILINDRTKIISDISYEPNQGLLINNKNFDEFIDSTDHVIKNDNYNIKFNDHKIHVPVHDPILNNPYFANGPIIKNLFEIEEWINERLIKSLELVKELFPKEYLNILNLSTHFFFIHNSSERFSSASSEKIPGLIYLPCINNVNHIAECIIHENLHQLLFRLEKLINFYNKGQNIESYWSPWRDDPRPLRMIMHGSFVFAGVSEFWMRMIKNKNSNLDSSYQFYLRLKQVKDGLKVLHNHADYSPAGEDLHNKVDQSLDGFNFDLIPNEIKKEANKALKRKRKKIDNERYLGF